jgi:hypothetical protein
MHRRNSGISRLVSICPIIEPINCIRRWHYFEPPHRRPNLGIDVGPALTPLAYVSLSLCDGPSTRLSDASNRPPQVAGLGQKGLSLDGPSSMPISAVALSFRRSGRASAVHPASAVPHRGRAGQTGIALRIGEPAGRAPSLASRGTPGVGHHSSPAHRPWSSRRCSKRSNGCCGHDRHSFRNPK